MRTRIPVALVATMVAGVVAGACSNDYFEGPRLNENPNKPSTAAADWTLWRSTVWASSLGFMIWVVVTATYLLRRGI